MTFATTAPTRPPPSNCRPQCETFALRWQARTRSVQAPAEILESCSNRPGKLLGARRRDHPFGTADEQFVLEHVTQSRQRMTHRRLTEAEARPGAGDASLLHHRVENSQEIEVHGAQFRARPRHGNSSSSGQIRLGHVAMKRMHFQHVGAPLCSAPRASARPRQECARKSRNHKTRCPLLPTCRSIARAQNKTRRTR